MSDGAAGVRAEGWPHFAERRIGEGSPALDKRDKIDNVSYLSYLICSHPRSAVLFDSRNASGTLRDGGPYIIGARHGVRL